MTYYNKDQEKDKTNETNGKKQAENAYQRSNLSKCFHIGQTGHLSNVYPKRKTVAILEEDEDYVEEQEEDLSQEEVLEPDDGERLSCVLQRVLITPKSDTSDQQRHSTIQGKVCSMISLTAATVKILSSRSLWLHLR